MPSPGETVEDLPEGAFERLAILLPAHSDALERELYGERSGPQQGRQGA